MTWLASVNEEKSCKYSRWEVSAEWRQEKHRKRLFDWQFAREVQTIIRKLVNWSVSTEFLSSATD